MRLLVVGASGLVGSHIYREAESRGWDVCGTYRNFRIDGLVNLNLDDSQAARGLLSDFRPDWVIHAAGWTWVDGCENDQERAHLENCKQPEMLAELCKEAGCRFTYISTTYVFDGESGPYDELDMPNPINVYAHSKWEAEQRIQAVLAGEALIPRVICVWGQEAQHKNFVYQVIKSLRTDQTMILPSDQKGNPTWAGDIAWWCLSLMEKGAKGVWNLAGPDENMSRVEWFCAIRRSLLKFEAIRDSEVSGYDEVSTVDLAQPAIRPLNASAEIKKIRSEFPDYTPARPGIVKGML